MSDLPGLFDVRVKARSIAYLFAAGATLGLLTLAFPHADEVRDVPLVVLAAASRTRSARRSGSLADRLRDWHIHAVLAAGTVIISLANYYAGPSTLYPILYMWTALYAFYFFPMRAGAGADGRSWRSRTPSCWRVQDADMVVVRWLLAVGTPLVAGILISRLLGGIQHHALRAERVRGAHAARARHRARRVHHARPRRLHHHVERGRGAACSAGRGRRRRDRRCAS